jgi:hypothetical protein
MSEGNSSSRFEAFLAIGIALATVIGALLAARASTYNDIANDADQEGLSSAIDLALAQSSIEAQRDQNLTAFLEFAQHRRQAELIVQQMKQLDPASVEWAQLDQQSSAEWNKAVNSRYFFNSDFYDKFTNTFDQQAFVDSRLTEQASFQDLTPEPHFTEAEEMRGRAAQMLGLIAALAVSLFFFAAANVAQSRSRYLLAGLGVVVLSSSVAAALLIEAGVL